MVVTSANQMPNGNQTGVWLSEFVEPYSEFIEKGYDVTVASPNGGKAPIDQGSLTEENEVPNKILTVLKNTLELSMIDEKDFAGIFLPGGHGTMFDLPQNKLLQELIKNFYENNKVVGAVCHGPAGLVNVTLSDGKALVEGKRLTSFTNSEERNVKLDQVVPFLLEDEFKARGAIFIENADWADHVESDGYLVTGQNPQSGVSTALEFIKILEA